MKPLFQHKRTVAVAVVTTLFGTCFFQLAYAQAPDASPAAAAEASAKSSPRSTLPKAALEKAREAEQHLAANQPDKAIEILKSLDKEYPGHAAISLRLAEIYDTNNQSGAALFYYRRYVRLAGNTAREIAVARVSTLELMAGVKSEADQVARSLGETTKPVATPAIQVKRELATEARDGSRVPLTSAEQLDKIQKLGYVPPAETKESIPTVTPGPTPIIVPRVLKSTPPPSGNRTSQSPSLQQQDSSPLTISGSASGSVARSPQVAIATTAPRKPDADALFTQAFAKADNPESVSTALAATPPIEVAPPVVAIQATPLPQFAPQAQLSPSLPVPPPASLSQAPLRDEPVVAYTKATPASDSPRAESFFNITRSVSNHAQVVLINELTDGVVSMSIVPPDDSEVVSAILAPGETKTLRVKPGTYRVTANASSTDYSPITLMNTQFQYQFQGGRQYTRRINQTSIQQLN